MTPNMIKAMLSNLFRYIPSWNVMKSTTANSSIAVNTKPKHTIRYRSRAVIFLSDGLLFVCKAIRSCIITYVKVYLYIFLLTKYWKRLVGFYNTCWDMNIFIRARNRVASRAVLAGMAVIGMKKLICEEVTIAIHGR